jgi:hypothetical protein
MLSISKSNNLLGINGLSANESPFPRQIFRFADCFAPAAYSGISAWTAQLTELTPASWDNLTKTGYLRISL